jgi:hypothetical protein
MAGYSKIADLLERKRALIAESDLHRQNLALELQNIRLYAYRLRQRVSVFERFKPLLILLPLVGAFAGRRFGRGARRKRRSRLGQLFAATLFGVRMYRRFGPVLRVALPSLLRRKRAFVQAGEQRVFPAEI